MMDYFLLSRLSTNNFIIDAMILLILIPFIQYVTSFLKNDFHILYERYKKSKWNVVKFDGWESTWNGIFYYDYPFPMAAICFLINERNLSSNLKYTNMERNSNFSSLNLKIDKNDNIFYMLDNKENIKINDYIYVDIFTNNLSNGSQNNNTNDNSKSNNFIWKVTMNIKSQTLSIDKIKEFIKKAIVEYKQFEEIKNSNKIYHFIYQKWDDNTSKPIFSQSILSNLDVESEKNYETFDTLFSENKHTLIKSINRLKDLEYYKRTGMKRKLGYLFYGPPGCGKTSHVVAMANHDKSHIIEVPMSRIKTNKEIEMILNIDNINNIPIKKENLIIFFDEIDQAGKAIAKREGEKTDESKEELKDKPENDDKQTLMGLLINSKNEFKVGGEDQLNLGCILSRLDGIGNYNGLKIIAATNCKEKLSPALYRHGRLTPLFFDYCRKEDIIDMIEHYYQIKLSDNQKGRLPDRTHQISPATIRKYLEDYENNSNGLIKYLQSKVK